MRSTTHRKAGTSFGASRTPRLADSSTRDARRTRGETVLVVADTRPLRQGLAGVLRRCGYQVMAASDVVKAQNLARGRKQIGLLLMDLPSPGYKHVQLAQWFCATYPNIKVLVASDAVWELYSDLEISPQIALLPKPFKPMELASMVRRVLDSA
jgi:DNA-binding NtrC family response regulator